MTANQVFITSMACFVGWVAGLYWMGRAIDWYEVRQRDKHVQKP